MAQTYYSVGGGFIKDEQQIHLAPSQDTQSAYPYDFDSAEELAALCQAHGGIADLMLANETALAGY